MKGEIKITELDYTRLCDLLSGIKGNKAIEFKNIDALGAEIKRAERIDSRVISSDYITMNSQFEVLDLDTKKSMVLKLVYPNDADFRRGHVSVLSPLGSALLGYKEGDIISFEVPKGTKEIQIVKIIYQPEASGDYTV